MVLPSTSGRPVFRSPIAEVAPKAGISPAHRSAAVRMGRGGTARPPEAEWSSGVAAFWGGSYSEDIFKDPRERHYHDVGVLLDYQVYSRKDYLFIFTHIYFPALQDTPWSQVSSLLPPRFLPSIFIAHRVQQSHCSLVDFSSSVL